jgi:arylsulfatase A-like enzyme
VNPSLCRVVLAALSLAWATAGTALSAERPNIVIILADDFGYADVSAYGGPVPTPNLDRLAREGTRFTQGYVAAPICSPSRCALITGQYPGRWRINSFLQARAGNRACEQADFLDPKAPSLPRTLKTAGYVTAHIGKWHLGGGRDVTNAPKFAAYGYDVGLGTYESPEPHPDITGTNWIWSPHDRVKRWDRSRWMVDRALDFLRERKGKPCFINLWLDDTHTPFHPSREQLAAVGVTSEKPSDAQRFRAVLHEMDIQMGRFMDGLRELGVDRNTLVFFLGDNGALPHFQTRNAPLRGSKLSLYEGGIRVPFIAHWPGRIPAGRVNDERVVSALDLFPTLCEIAEAKPPTGTRFDGVDMSAALFGKGPARDRELFFEYGRNTNSFGYPRIKRDRSPNVAVRDGPWKLLLNADGTDAELYNIPVDIGETNDLASSEPKRVERLSKAALAWRKSLP